MNIKRNWNWLSPSSQSILIEYRCCLDAWRRDSYSIHRKITNAYHKCYYIILYVLFLCTCFASQIRGCCATIAISDQITYLQFAIYLVWPSSVKKRLGFGNRSHPNQYFKFSFFFSFLVFICFSLIGSRFRKRDSHCQSTEMSADECIQFDSNFT